ncbi:MAG: cytochrome c biogenesis heme-transporting ATPase CcmA [Psychrosphaera sp.]|nr:cytochrome c biogenesis heme-transporting ATPase CcmA [Psychrosphaera sp.]
MSVAFSAKNLCCIRQDRCLFEGLGFELGSGEIVQVEGPNGAGKSSLLRILAGFLTPESGELYWGKEGQGQELGRDRSEFNEDLLFIGHKAAINPHMSAIENVQFWMQLHYSQPHNSQPHNSQEHDSHKSLPTTDEIFDLLGRLGLVGLEDVPTSQLSAGQQRKVALARLWLSKAKFWILDEPFTAIDKKGVSGLQVKFQQHLDSGGMIVLTTHQDLTASFERLKTVRLEYQF